MSNSEITWKYSIFTRLIITFLLIMVPVFFLGIGIFQWSSRQLSNEISSSVKSQVTYYLNAFNNEIERIKNLQYNLTQDADLNQITNANVLMDNFEETKAILRIQQRLSAIKSSSPYIENVRAMIPSLGWVIKDNEGMYGDITEADVDAVKKIPADTESQIIYKDGKLCLLAVFPIYYDNEPLFIIEINFSSKAMKDAVMQLNSYSESGFVMKKDTGGFSLSDISDEELERQVQDMLAQQLKKSNNGAVSVKIAGRRYLLIYDTSKFTGITLCRIIPQDSVFKSINKLEIWYLVFSFLAIAVIIIYSLYSYRLLRKPLTNLVKSFGKIETGDFQVNTEYKRKDELGYLYRHFAEMVKNLKILIDQAYKQKILTQKAELKQLQSQINPHFLYNSFFILHRRIKGGDYDNAILFSQQLGNYFRFITRSAADEVTLEKEAEHARIYAEIQGMRFSNRITVDFKDLQEEMKSVIVPRLILQPLIENAFEYGLENKKENGILSVRFLRVESGIIISVEDNGEGPGNGVFEKLQSSLENTENMAENTGMINIHRRIQLKFGEKSGLAISKSGLGGMKVEIFLDLSTEEKHV